MTLFSDLFDRADRTAGLGGSWDSYSAAGVASAQWTIVSQQAVSGSATTNMALWQATPGADQFAQIQFANNVGVSTGVLLRAALVSTGPGASGYLIRHTGSNIAIISFAADGTTTASLANVAHTRAVNQIMCATAATVSGVTTIIVYVDGTEVLRYVDSANLWPTGKVGIRSATTAAVAVDNFYGGDLANIGSAPGGVPAPVVPVTETINPVPAGVLPGYRGLVVSPSGRLVHKGKLLHRMHADFWGAAGAYTPPAWLTVASGTATLTAPSASVGALELATAAAVNATAALNVVPVVNTTNHRAFRIDLEGLVWTAADPAAELRIGVTDASGGIGGGMAQLEGGTDGRLFLYSGGETQRTKTESSHLGPGSTQRRQTSLLVLPQDKMLFILEDDEVVAWRDGAVGWSDGTATIGVQIKAKTGTAVTLRLTSMTVSTYA